MESFQVDLTDPEAIREALDEVTRQVQDKRVELAEWEALKSRLAVLNAGLRPRAGTSGDTIQQGVVAAVNELGRPIRASDVAAILPADTAGKTINWALWKSEQEGLIKKLEQGVYAPLDYVVSEQDVLPLSENGTMPGDS